MATATRRASQRLTLLILVLASITVLTLDYHGEARKVIDSARNDVRDVLSPIQRGISAALHPVGDVFAGAFHYGALVTENQRLQQQLGALQARLSEDEATQQSARRVLELSGLDFVQNVPTTPAEVISQPTSNFVYTLEIDRGSSSGIGDRMPVVAGRGLVGVVVDAGRTTAEVQLVTDHASSVAVSYGSGSSTGSAIAQGQGIREPLAVEEVSGPTPRVGEILSTSSTDGGAFPAGIPLGAVSSVRTSDGGLSTSVFARPLVDLTSLQYVSVLEWLPAP